MGPSRGSSTRQTMPAARACGDSIHSAAVRQTVIGVLRQMKAAGKGVIGMKILGAGRLRDRVEECLQFAMALDCVDCITIGSESRGELADLVQKIPAASVRG